KKIIFIIALFVFVSARASIVSFNTFIIDFTNSPAAITNASWSENISISVNGLGWDGRTNQSREMWIQSVPIAIGNAWRPPRSVTILAEINPRCLQIGRFFVRYSSDGAHWSTWQVLEEFHGLVEVARS